MSQSFPQLLNSIDPALRRLHTMYYLRYKNWCFVCVLISLHSIHQCYESCRFRQYRKVSFRNKVFSQNVTSEKKKGDFANITKYNDLAFLLNFQLTFLKSCLKSSEPKNLSGVFYIFEDAC